MAEEKVKKESPKKESVIDRLNKDYGKGTIVGGNTKADDVKAVKTGSLTLDIATGIGGNPEGKLIEIFGPESSGKSTLALHCIAEFQKAGKKSLLADYEHSFDKKYARALGVDVDELLISQPRTMEDGYNIICRVIESEEFGLIVLDSQTAMVPAKCLEGDIGDAKMALQARINSEAYLKIHRLLDIHNVTMIVISQLRTNIGGYGDPNIPTGGNALKFYCDMRYKVSKQLDKEHDHNKTTVEVIKNKCASPFGKAEFKIKWGIGIDRMQEILDLAVEYKFIEKGGAGWYTIGETKLQGDEKVKEFLTDNPTYALELETKVLNKIKEI